MSDREMRQTVLLDTSRLRNLNIHKNCTHSVVKDFRGCVKAVITLMNRKPQAYSVVGMDCEMERESTHGPQQIPVILQLANPDGFCAVFQLRVMSLQEDNLCSLKQSSLKILLEVLEDPTILKVGVGVVNDAQNLEKRYGIICKGCLDIRYIAEEAGVPPKNLEYLALEVLRVNKTRMKKGGGWGKEELSQKQIDYAVQDARLGVNIFMDLNNRVIDSRFGLERRMAWDEKTYWKHTISLWDKYINKHFNFTEETTAQVKLDRLESIIRSSLNVTPESTRFMPHSPTFIPHSTSFIPHSTRFIPESARRCVVCGFHSDGDTWVRRKAIVPEDYVVSHDGFLLHFDLCERCFKRNQKEDCILREELTDECGAPYPEYQNEQLVKAKTIVMEIMSKKGNDEHLLLQQYRLSEMFHLRREQLNSQMLETIAAMDCWPGSAHGEFVSQYYSRFCGTEKLKMLWCRRFVETMEPKYLPTFWLKHIL